MSPWLRLAGFLGLIFAGAILIGLIWNLAGAPRPARKGVVLPGPFLAAALLMVSLGLGATAVALRRLERRGLGTVGLGFAPGWARRLGVGALAGSLTPVIVVIVLAGAGAVTMTGATPDWLRETLPMVAALIAVSSWEEIALRGYLVQLAAEIAKPWIAAAISGVIFGLMHAGNPGASPLGLLFTAVNGMLLALVVIRTGSLWFACAYHAAWNIVASVGLGLRDSGVTPVGALVTTDLGGPTLWSGGAYGFEASLATGLVEFAILGGIVLLAPRLGRNTASGGFYQGKAPDLDPSGSPSGPLEEGDAVRSVDPPPASWSP